MTVDETAAKLGITTSHLKRLIASGDGPKHLKLNPRWDTARFKPSDVEDWIDARINADKSKTRVKRVPTKTHWKTVEKQTKAAAAAKAAKKAPKAPAKDKELAGEDLLG